MKLTKLKTKFLGKENFYYKIIDSTQSEIWRMIKENKIQNGTLIFSDIQTNGIGTHGRKWYTDEEKNIAFSFYTEMNCNISKIEGLTIKIAEIIVQIFKDKYNIKLQIKKPNDIYCNGKKVAGILTESKVYLDKTKYLVIGIGVNTNKEKFSEEIRENATSIKKEFQIEVDTKDFITEFCNKFEKEILTRRQN